MYASGALIPTDAQLSGLERGQNSVMGSSKTVLTLRDEDETEAKVRTPQTLAVEVCLNLQLQIMNIFFYIAKTIIIMKNNGYPI